MWPENEDQWATICACERPSELNMAAIKPGFSITILSSSFVLAFPQLAKPKNKLNELIMPDIGDSVIDLRALSLREWSVEFLWKLKQAELDLNVSFRFTIFIIVLFRKPVS